MPMFLGWNAVQKSSDCENSLKPRSVSHLSGRFVCIRFESVFLDEVKRKCNFYAAFTVYCLLVHLEVTRFSNVLVIKPP
jgi:hypothetical protein